MPRAATLVLLTAPPVLAFHSGGYFSDVQRVAALVALALVAIAAAVVRRPPPVGRAGVVALAAFVLLCLLTVLSTGWAPLREPAEDDSVRLVLYLGVLLLAVLAAVEREAARMLEPGLALGALVVIGYGLSERLAPGLVELSTSASAGGRLEQPLTYWNATGALAAMGAVLAMRIAGDRSRELWLRMAGAAAVAPFGAGVAVSLSRGAIAAFAAGVVALVLLCPERSQLRAAVAGAAVALAVAVPALLLPGVRALEGSDGSRAAQGLAMAAVLIVVAVAAAACARALCGREGAGSEPLGITRRGRLAGPMVAAAAERSAGGEVPEVGRSTKRLTDVRSNRYDYWEVALRAFADNPLAGVGSGGFRAEWVRERPIRERATDAHSLPLETAAELGAAGLVLLLLFAGAVAAAGRTALARDPQLVAGWCALLVVFAFHSGLDWDWEIPAVALMALVPAGALLSRAAAPRVG